MMDLHWKVIDISFLSTKVLGRHNTQCHYPPHSCQGMVVGWQLGVDWAWLVCVETAACKSRRPAPPRTHRSCPAHCSLHRHRGTWGHLTHPQSSAASLLPSDPPVKTS